MGQEVKSQSVALRSPRRHVALLALAAIFIIARQAIGWWLPLRVDDDKFVIYLRDVIFLGPAAALLCFALADERLLPLARGWTEFLCARISPVSRAVMTGLVCGAVAVGCFGGTAQIIDEAVYLFQAHVFQSGHLSMPVPAALAGRVFGDYVAVDHGRAYGIFFPGQSLALLAGVVCHVPWLVNPTLVVLLGLLTYRAGRSLYGERPAAVASVLLLLSPFVLFQGASYFSHVLAACLFSGSLFLFVLSTGRANVRAGLSGVLAGALFLTRPLSAAVLVLCVLWHVLQTGGLRRQCVRLAAFAPGVAAGVIALLLYDNALTGHPFLTPHDAYFGHSELHFGFNVVINTLINFCGLAVDLFGLPVLSLAPLAWLVLRVRHLDRQSRFFLSVCALYILAYGLYEYHGLSYGPRFWFELVPILCLLTARALSEWESSAGTVAVARNGTAIFVTTASLIVACGILPNRIPLWAARGTLYSPPADIATRVQQPAIVFMKQQSWKHLNAQIAGLQHDGPLDRTAVLFLRDSGLSAAAVHSMFPQRSLYCLDLAGPKLTNYPCTR